MRTLIRWRRCLYAALLVTCAVGPLLVGAGYGQDRPPAAAPDVARELLALVNAERWERGLSALTLDARLTAAARAQAQDCARRHLLTHAGSDGSTSWDRIARAGYRCSTSGECAAMGTPYADGSLFGPRGAIKLWLGDGPHRAILRGPYRHLGVAAASDDRGNRYVVADFASPTR